MPPRFTPWLRRSRYKGAHGGRGSAKSWTAGRLLLAFCLRHLGTRWVCVREIQLTLKQSVKRLLDDIIKAFALSLWFLSTESQITTPGAGVIVFLGMQNHTAESIKSLEGFHGAWVEEAQSLSARSLELLRPTIREEWVEDGELVKSELWFTWNPDKRKDPVDQLLRANPPADAIVVEANHNDNPYFPEVLRQEMATDYARDPEGAAHVWGGKYRTRTKASVFKNWRVQSFDTPADAAFLFGADWGFSVDPSVLVRSFVADGELRDHLIATLALSGRPVLCIDREVYKVGCEIDDTPALFDGLDPDRPGMARPWKIVADSARPETISYMQRHGYPNIEPARKGAGSVEEGVTFLQSFDVVVHPRCPNCVDEMTSYSYKVHPLTGDVMPVLEDKKNHVIDAIRYEIEPLNQDAESGAIW